MKSFAFDQFDGGRLTVNRDYVSVLQSNRLLSFDALMRFDGGRVAKNVLRERTTTRIELAGAEGTPRAFYLKRHAPPPWKEYVKPLLRLTRPILGARNEWEALIRFHAVGIPTMIPVALGQTRRHSFLLTAGIEGCAKLSQLIETGQRAVPGRARRIIANIAEAARRMHGAGMHHQDFYLTHLLVPEQNVEKGLYVIDLGRVRCRRRLSRRWIVKDLAQLNYSATHATTVERFRFLRDYLQRPFGAADRALVRRILRKTEAITRHSRKNRL